MKIKVDTAKCVGHARCEAAAPEVYELNDDGFNITAEIDVPENLEQKAIRGMRACPERIISTVDDE